MLEAQANIAELRARLDTETRVSPAASASRPPSTGSARPGLRASLDAQRAKVLRMKAVRDEGAVLVRDVENAQRAYDAVLARLNQTSLESQTTQSNIIVLGRANPPAGASSPKVVLNTALSVVLGVLLAVGAVLALELIDRRVRAYEDVTVPLGLPVIGVMPKPSAQMKLGSKRLSLMQQRLVASLPAPQKG